MHQSLHPLLCVRVLQRLGYAVWKCEAAQKKGWSVRHTYPSLRCCSDATVSSTESSSSHSVASTAYANAERVAGAVLAPLLPLLGDGTGAHPPHSKVLSVLPVIVEWLCTLPTPESAVPLDFWLPWVVTVYTEAHEGRRSLFQSLQLPPLLDLLPHLMRKLSIHLEGSTAVSQKATPPSPSTLSERCLASLFTLVPGRSSVQEDEPVERESKMAGYATGKTGLLPAHCAVDQHSGLKLADILWWHGEAPLLRLAGVHRALEQAGQTVPLASGAAPPPPATTMTWTTTSGDSSMPLLHLQGDQEYSVSRVKHAPHVTVPLPDDDAYRRFLLRLAALQSASLVNAAASPSSEIPPALVSVCLTGAAAPRSTDSGCDGARGALSEDPDMILRFIQPLYEYLCVLQESSAQWSGTRRPTASATAGAVTAPLPVQLTFTSIVRVLMAVFGRLEDLKQQSSCQSAAAATPALRTQASPSEPSGSCVTAFVLLPQKARLHLLKSLCELLLRHVRAVQVSKSASSPTGSGAAPEPVCVRWFVDVEVSHQEAILRRLCGAARALVRVVMEERRRSLLEEGPEGSVLTASSVTMAQQHRAASGSSGASRESRSSATAPLASAAVFERTLRNTAFRVVEPALSNLHDACVEARTSVPLHVLSFEEWRSYLSVLHTKAAKRGALAGLLTSSAAESVEQVYIPIMAAALSLFDSIGGRAGLRTAQQVLPHPSQQSVSALVEGIRLTALQCFLFDGLRSGGSPSCTTIASAYIREEAATYMSWVLHHLPHAFFSVWHRTASPPTLANPSSAPSEVTEAAAADQRLLRYRLGLLTLLLHVRVLGARQLLRGDAALLHKTSPSRPSLGANPVHAQKWVGDVPSSLDSLLHCMTKDGAAVPNHSALRDEWSLVLPPAILEACVVPPLPAGCTALWELVEELQDLADASKKGENASESPASGSEWVWLGSPEALYDVLGASLLKKGGGDSTTGVFPCHVYYLLPWTTLAHSHQPWRIYDEGGQARGAAQEWAATLHSWLTGSTSMNGVKEAPSQRHPDPIVRLVSMKEELSFFACMTQVSLLHLSADVWVVRSDVRREEREVAPAVRRVLTASQEDRTATTTTSSAAVTECSGWYAEEDCDGLD
ncbi:hypothetical protein JKF63_06604 [Porcisia hertigi]|uniref:Uncharacterized protein n=1 Tax=Porcisia hertigi TaxID=2761500 RepID=A0A836IXM4_9TRYP|nr:hypothetical protein JKF63_06604 [Porcisia hertigi]